MKDSYKYLTTKKTNIIDRYGESKRKLKFHIEDDFEITKNDDLKHAVL